MAETHHDPLGEGRRRHRHPHPRRPEPVGEHDERGLRARRSRATVDRLEAEKDDIKGVVITSAKKTFFAGGDLNDLKTVTPENAERVRRASSARARRRCAAWRRSASRSSPPSTARRSAAAWRSASPRHHRVIVDDPKAVVGFPEVQLGLLPGAGGVVRSVRMLGIVDALMQLLLQGKRLKPGQGARSSGIVDEVVATRDDLVPAAKKWIEAQPRGRRQPWDVRRATRSPAARRRTRSWRRTCRRSRPTCASSSRARTTRPRTTSWPRPSRARRSTSTTRSRSRAATSSTSPPARSRRT